MNKKMRLVTRKHRKNKERMKRIKLAILSSRKKTKAEAPKKTTTKVQTTKAKAPTKKSAKKVITKKAITKKRTAKKAE